MIFSSYLLTSLLAGLATLGVAQSSCDSLVPEYCMLPFPSDYWRIETENGYRLNFTTETFPVDDNGKPIDPVYGKWNELHGFPVFPAITTYFHRMDESSIESCPRWWNMETSLEESSPTVLIDTKTLKIVPHWVELDHSSNITEVTGKHAMLIWPATALEFDRRYIVAIKPMKDKDGKLIEPSASFKSIRDGTVDRLDGKLMKRKSHFDQNIFSVLEKVGIPKSNLLLAWDFTTNDKDDVTGRTIAARDDARARLGTEGPKYMIHSVEYNTTDLVGKQIKGQFYMPTYMNTHKPSPTARLVLDEDNKPVFQGYQWYEFEVIVPKAFVDAPKSAGIMQYGHGLFGSYREVEYGSSTYMYEDATNYGYVICASTWIGLSEQDIPAIGTILAYEVSNFQYIPDRSTQGFVNALGLMMMMKGAFSQDPVMLTSSGESILDTEKTSYFGNSEGGIFGTVYMALTQDVKRGLLGVPGGPYGMMLPRSLDFSIEFDVLKVRYSDPVDRINLMQVMQLLWDRAEPAGFMGSISRDPFPNTEKHEVLLHYGLGDAQVTWLGAQSIARACDAVMYSSNAKENEEHFFGFEMLDDSAVVTGKSGIVGWDFMSPQAPLYNVPPCEEGDTHEDPRRDDRAQEQMGHFFLTGEIINTCGGTCVSDTKPDRK